MLLIKMFIEDYGTHLLLQTSLYSGGMLTSPKTIKTLIKTIDDIKLDRSGPFFTGVKYRLVLYNTKLVYASDWIWGQYLSLELEGYLEIMKIAAIEFKIVE